MSKEKILIIGNSYIGSSFISKHINKYNFIVSTREKNLYSSQNCVLYVDNLLNNPSNINNFNDVKSIIFTASPSSFTQIEEKELKIYLKQLEAFIERIKSSSIQNFVYLSSSALYGIRNENKPFEENDTLFNDTVYRKEKLLSEKLIVTILKNTDKKFKILRISNPYGFVDKIIRPIGFINQFIFNIKNRSKTVINNEGLSVRDFVYIDDLISAIDLAVNSSLNRSILNVGAGVGSKLLDVVDFFKSSKIDFKFEIDKKNGPVNDYSVLNLSKVKAELNYSPKFSLKAGLKNSILNFDNKYE